jgi:hypothetical protein
MKKKLLNFVEEVLSKNQMKGVKGAGPMYCDCGGGNATPNPDPANNDCMYVCSGASPYNTNYGLGGSAAGGGSPSQYKNPYNPGTPCIPNSLFGGAVKWGC